PSGKPSDAAGWLGPGAAFAFQPQGQGGTGGHRAASVREQIVRNRTWRDDRVSPGVQCDELGKQVGPAPVRVAGDRVDPQQPAHGYRDPGRPGWRSPGTGSTGGRPTRGHGPYRRWFSRSAPNTWSALATRATAPSGKRHAPRPFTSGSSSRIQASARSSPPCQATWSSAREMSGSP